MSDSESMSEPDVGAQEVEHVVEDKRKGLLQSQPVPHVTQSVLVKKTPSTPSQMRKDIATLSPPSSEDIPVIPAPPTTKSKGGKDNDSKKKKNRPKSMVFASPHAAGVDLRSSGENTGKKDRRKMGKSYDFDDEGEPKANIPTSVSEDKIDKLDANDIESAEQKRARRKSQVLPPILHKEKEKEKEKKGSAKEAERIQRQGQKENLASL